MGCGWNPSAHVASDVASVVTDARVANDARISRAHSAAVAAISGAALLLSVCAGRPVRNVCTRVARSCGESKPAHSRQQ